MNYMRAYENALNHINRWPGSTTNLREGLRDLADAYLMLMGELQRAQDKLEDLEEALHL